MIDAYTVLVEAARGALVFFQLENAMHRVGEPAKAAYTFRQSSCVGKVRFDDPAIARAVDARRKRHARDRRAMQNHGVYRCRECGGWHIGRQS